ncbi:MAG TPA: beta-ketoacyl-ACP synthase II [Gemmatimonadota bacterium]|nr:beta-ketoacyl-ACP synthase II [Gemmatimonadota bacterium]
MGRRVVVTGMGLLTALGNDLATSWESLLQGKNGVRRISRFDPAGFATQIAAEVNGFDPERYIDRKETRRQDLFTQFAVACSIMAVEDSDLDMGALDPTRIGVIIGSGIGGIATHEIQNQRYLQGGPSRISPFYIPMMIPDIASGIVSMRFGAKGPNYCTVSACASSAHAIGDAFRLIKHGDAEIMIAGGTEAAVTAMSIGGFAAMKAMSTRNDEPEKASRPFDAERDGFVLGEGAGMAVLEELEHARARRARIYAEVVGIGMTADAYHITAPAPGGEGAARAMQRALDEAGLEPDDVDYINAHGTSTPLNDAYETQAIKTVFGDHAYRLMVGSTKSMTGHLLGGAGGLEFVVTAMVLAEGKVPPTINYEVPDPDCDLDYVPNRMREAKVRAALTNSLGFGGHNATLALRRLEE